MNTLFRCLSGILVFLQLHSIAQIDTMHFVLRKTITGGLTPKSVIYAGNGLFFAQNMMYRHTIQVFDSAFALRSTIKDDITPSNFGFTELKGKLRGAPVEAVATKDGKYVWVSNYFMTGEGFSNPGCDNCCCKGYDESFLYKINTQTFEIENIVKVGSVPKYLTITPNQEKLLVSNWSSGDISIVDLHSEKETKRINVGRHPRGIVCNKEGTMAYVAVMGGSFILKIDLENFNTEKFVSPGKNPRHLCLDENYLYVSLNGEQNIARINLYSSAIEKLKVGNMPRSMVLAPNSGKLFVNCYGDSKVVVIDTRIFEQSHTFKTNGNPIGIALSPDEKKVWVACYTGSLQIFEYTKQDLVSHKKEIKPDLFANLVDQIHHKNQQYILTNNINTGEQPSGYYVVLGSFKEKKNALKLKKSISKKGLTPKIIVNDNGFTYCAIGSFDKKEETVQSIEEIELKSGVKGWIYLRKTSNNSNTVP